MGWNAESRLAEVIRERVANCVLFELQDPRISFVTVTRVKLAKDLTHCRVYYSVLGTPAERSKTAHALRDARGFVQREVAKVLRTRVTPHLEFVFDESIEGGLRIGTLLDQLQVERGDTVEQGAEVSAHDLDDSDAYEDDDSDEGDESGEDGDDGAPDGPTRGTDPADERTQQPDP